jgi:hypothetical protein
MPRRQLLALLAALAGCSRPDIRPPPEPAPSGPVRLELSRAAALDDGATATLSAHGARVTVVLAGEEVTLDGPGSVAWTSDRRVVLAGRGPGPPPWVELAIGRVSDAAVPGSATTLRLARGESAALGDGLTARFVGHGHKIVEAGGPESPLLVHVEYLEDGRPPVRRSHAVEPGGERGWRHRDRRFRLLEHVYDERMVVEVSRLALEPVGLAR